jgi:hypothetical protein
MAFGIAIGVGLLVRVGQYAANTSIWHDEAYVALNVVQKSFAGLFGPLAWHEASPPGFLVIEKLAVNLLGRSEYALRLVPLAAGLAGVAACALLARRAAAGLAGVWMMLMLAASDKLIVQSNEAKHFTIDVLAAAVITLAALAVLARPQRWPVVIGWGVVAAIGLWFSYAATFTFAGTSLALAPGVLRARSPRTSIAFVAANAAAALSFWVLLTGPVEAQLEDGVLGFWAGAFPPTASATALIAWLGHATLGFFNYFWQPLGLIIAALTITGGAVLWRHRRRAELAIFALPVAAALAAAAFHRWPFGGNQHMVFAAPGVLLLTAAGLEATRRRLESTRRGAGAVAVALVLLPGVAQAIYHLARPRERHEARPAIEFLMAEREPGDQLLVYCPAEFEFYTGTNPPPLQPEPATRVWFIGTRSGDDPFPAQPLLDELHRTRPLLASKETYGAASYLFGPAAPGERPR